MGNAYKLNGKMYKVEGEYSQKKDAIAHAKVTKASGGLGRKHNSVRTIKRKNLRTGKPIYLVLVG